MPRWRGRSEHDFADEIRAGIALETDRLVADGMPPEEARLAALRAFGNVTRSREQFYESRHTLWADDLLRDVRFAWRTLLRAPAFTIVSVLTLAVGIGAGTLVYTFARAVLLRPLPYNRPEQLVRIFETNPLKGWTRNIASLANYADWKARNAVFTDIAAYDDSPRDAFLTGAGDAQPLKSATVTGNLFHLLGVAPLAGRVFEDAETFTGADAVTILSYGTWQHVFAADPAIVGRPITLNGRETQVIGVMPEGFFFPGRDAQIWQPLGVPPELFKTSRRPHQYSIVARLKPDASFDRAGADMVSIAHALEREYPDTNTQMGVRLEPFHASLAYEPRPALVMLAAAVAVLFLLVCLNIANLQIGRLLARAREFETRRALGASGGRLARQLGVESLLLSVAGGGLGIAIAAMAGPALVRLAPAQLPSFADVRVDGSVVVFAVLLAVAAPGLWALAPAFSTLGRGHLNDRGGSASRRTRALRNMLIAAETGLSVVLLVGSMLLVRSMISLGAVDPGFSADHVLTFRLTLRGDRYSSPVADLTADSDIERRIRGLPGVESVGASSSIALQGYTWTGDATVEGRAPDDYERELRHASITPGYFETMRIRLLAGRMLDAHDTIDQPPVAVVNEALARQYLRGADPLATRIRFGRPQDSGPWVRIVGVVADEKQDGLDQAARPTAYSGIAQRMMNPMTFVLRTPLAADAAVGAIRRQVQEVDPNLAMTSVAAMDDVVDESLDGYRFRTVLLSAFAGIALLLAALGTYGVLAYIVSQRKRELGIRVALGAARPSLFGLVVAQGMRPVAAGLVAGLAGALAVARLMQSLIFGVSPIDAVSFVAAILVLVAVSLVACALPAWRAMGVDPVVALRCE
jgi:predicted permease